jgi:hypothetical protein
MQNKKPKSINVSPEVHTDLLSLKVDLCRNGKSEMCNSMDSLINYLITQERENPIEHKLIRLDRLLTDKYHFPRSAEEILRDLQEFIKMAQSKNIYLPEGYPELGAPQSLISYKNFLMYLVNQQNLFLRR